MSASIGSIKRRDPDLTLLKEYAATRKVAPTRMLEPLPIKVLAFSAEQFLTAEPVLYIRGTNPSTEKPSARMIRLRLVKNARSLFLRNRGDKRFFMIDAGMHSL
jgi:hypothetical protein